MEPVFATVAEEDGVSVTSAEVNGFTLSELRFPRSYVQAPFEPDLPYLAVVLEGGLVKSFPRRALELKRASAVAIPQAATHGARFGSAGARILIVRPRSASDPVAGCFDRIAELRGRELTWLAWRLAGELRAEDAAAPLAAEGFALELLAATTRETRAERPHARPPAWLRAAEELLRARLAERIGLAELAETVGVHPAYLSRAFRAHYGLSVGEYGRRLRLAWAAAELAGSETPLAEIAANAGFADQSHFTRVFRRHVGATPARYRAQARSRTFQDG
ncbi:MAG: AraC family transcriptional regulator [Actinomycetota bacterium]|nr:AraC family transcriptional regulator [Actinomycetota bacterium]